MVVAHDAILAVIAVETGLDRDALKADATFEQLDIGSLDLASALFTLEDEFGVVVDPDQFTPTSTIAEFVEYVSRQAST